MSNRVSYSKIDLYWTCPHQYKLTYIDKLKPKPDDNPASALYEGSSLHEAIEKRSIDEGLNLYKSKFETIGKEHEFEMYKLKLAMSKALNQIPSCDEYEYKLLDEDGFIGYIDALVKVDEGVYDIYDFKYSNSVNNYKESGQVHLYKYYYERLTGNTVRDLYYVMIPKCPDKYDENIDYNKLLNKADKFYDSHDVTFEKVEYDKKKINFFFARKAIMEKDKIFEKRYSFKCGWCPFQKHCASNGKDKSELLDDLPKEVSLWG